MNEIPSSLVINNSIYNNLRNSVIKVGLLIIITTHEIRKTFELDN